MQRIFSICVGHGAADKKGEVKAKECEEDLKIMVEEYRARDAVGECFVHIRKRHSSNKDLSVLSRLTEGSKFYKVNLQGKEMESIVTKSARLARIIKEAESETSKESWRRKFKEASEKRIRKDSNNTCWKRM